MFGPAPSWSGTVYVLGRDVTLPLELVAGVLDPQNRNYKTKPGNLAPLIMHCQQLSFKVSGSHIKRTLSAENLHVRGV